jgi:BolA family transcriptional regulator, general stress-responsive regulator
MNITAQSVREQLSKQLQPTFLEVLDESAQHAGHSGSNGTDEGTHFRVRIASPQFDGRPRVAKHRLVYDALQEFIDQGLHALAIEVVDNPS